MREACVNLLAEMEARLDFAEELPDLDTTQLQEQIVGLQERLEAALRTGVPFLLSSVSQCKAHANAYSYRCRLWRCENG